MIGKPENKFKLVINRKRTRKFLAVSLVTGQSRQVLEMVVRVDFFFSRTKGGGTTAGSGRAQQGPPFELIPLAIS